MSRPSLADIELKENKHYLVKDTGYKTPCWLWLGNVSTEGYARMKKDYVEHTLHRFLHCRKFNIDINDFRHADHLCCIRRCINPDHVEMVTLAENVLRGEGHSARAKRSTHCTRCGGDYKIHKRKNRPDSRYCPKCQYNKQLQRQGYK